MSKHTPGPWELEGLNIIKRLPKYTINITSLYVRFSATTDQEARLANANLIAAAPELLEACHSALIMFDCFGGHESTGLVEILKSAIKKAEGQL
jgi:hypothetical protein